MGRFAVVKEFLFPGSAQGISVPPLDGDLTPNDRLDAFDEVAPGCFVEPDDVLPTEDGGLLVSAGEQVLAVDGSGGVPTVLATLPGPAGALAVDGSGAVLVCVAGVGLCRVRPGGAVDPVLTEVDGIPLTCLTAVAAAPDGTVYVTDGARSSLPADWAQDLMRHGASGRLVRLPPDGRAEIVADGLRYPHGVAASTDGSHLVLTEAWSHTLSRVALEGQHRVERLQVDLPGYPARISQAPGGYYWLAYFALRTQLVEFVLEEDDYRNEMMRTIRPEFWIRPALRDINSGLVPLQGGQIRKLGVLKPWAPPRSYGLVARIDDSGEAVESHHSRPGASRHGVASARQRGDSLYVACTGGDSILMSTVVDR